jgi:hypothetical protein
MEVAGLALDHLLFWDPSDFPISSLCSLLPCFLKTVSTAVFLVTLDLRIVTSTMQTGHDLSRFSGVRFPAFSTTESMTQSLGFEYRPACFAWLGRSILQIQTESCPPQFRLIRALRTAGDCARAAVKFLLTDDTILGWILPPNPSVPPFATAFSAAGFCSTICLEDLFADDARFRIHRPILKFFLL